MVRPARFAFNEETAGNNAFQQKSEDEYAAQRIQRKAVEEFDAYVTLLRSHGVTVDVIQDTPEPFTPDSIFPNNCFSTHRDTSVSNSDKRTLVIYPMFAPNRRRERDKLTTYLKTMTFDHIIDLTPWEQEGKFLEGTGSLILDREHRVAYACRSPRTDETVLRDWASKMDYRLLLFDSADEHGTPVYHTNVVMSIGTRFAIVCSESIADKDERQRLREHIESCGKEVVDITFSQMNSFAGNMLEIKGRGGEKLLVMSTTALASLTPAQKALLEEDVTIVAPHIPTIEQTGGGSARCMIAEIF